MLPETRYARAGSIHIAYQVFGDGPVDLVLVPGWVSHVDVFWDEPIVARFLLRLAEFSRVILFDKRGTGLSDHVTDPPSLEERMDDVRAVLDEVGSDRVALAGYSEGGPMCLLFAATYPSRTEALITIGSYSRRQYAADYPCGMREHQDQQLFEMIENEWGGPVGIDLRAPTLASDQRFCDWWARFLRAGASPAAVAGLIRANAQIDVRSVLSSIQAPSLLLHATRDMVIPVEASRYMARYIEGAKIVEIDAVDHLPFGDGAEQISAEIERFLTGKRNSIQVDRVIATVMFTDIVESTRLAESLGDRPWRDLLEAHHKAVRQELSIHRGNEVKSTGDGFHATFDGPARAIQCARAIRESTSRLGLDLRIGIHTGECEVRGDSLEGVAIHIAARVANTAGSGEIVVSRTVRDLVAGAGIEFDDFGEHDFKGVPDRHQLYRVKNQ